jgi:hypothetical protein
LYISFTAIIKPNKVNGLHIEKGCFMSRDSMWDSNLHQYQRDQDRINLIFKFYLYILALILTSLSLSFQFTILTNSFWIKCLEISSWIIFLKSAINGTLFLKNLAETSKIIDDNARYIIFWFFAGTILQVFDRSLALILK